MTEHLNNRIARMIYEADPIEVVGECIDGFPVSPSGKLTWKQACDQEAEFGDDPNCGPAQYVGWCRALAMSVIGGMEMDERTRRFIEEEGPWNNGGKQGCCDRAGIDMSHDELAKLLGDSYQKILDAGFVMVPKKWRDDAMAALQRRETA